MKASVCERGHKHLKLDDWEIVEMESIFTERNSAAVQNRDIYISGVSPGEYGTKEDSVDEDGWWSGRYFVTYLILACEDGRVLGSRHGEVPEWIRQNLRGWGFTIPYLD